MLGNYEQKLGEFIQGKTFRRLSLPLRNRADAWCDACGSLEPRLLFGLREEATERYFFVGAECLKEISRRGVVRRAYCRQGAEAAFGEEMARRGIEGGCAVDASQPVHEIQQYATLESDTIPLQPKVYFFETAESYVALVQLWHRGRWVWGSGEAPRLHDIWERDGVSGAILRRVPRDRADAMAECVTIASEKAMGILAADKAGQPGSAMLPNSGRHDWTGFWRAVRELGLDQDQVTRLADGLTPRDWLEKHPERRLDDLLRCIQEKWQEELSLRSAATAGALS